MNSFLILGCALLLQLKGLPCVSHPCSPPAIMCSLLPSPTRCLSIYQHLKFNWLLFQLQQNQTPSHFHPQTLGKQLHQVRNWHFFTLRHALEVQLLFFFLHPPIYSNTLRGTSIKVRSACADSSIERKVLYQWYLLPPLSGHFQLL